MKNGNITEPHLKKSPLLSGTLLCLRTNRNTSRLNVLYKKFIILLSSSLLWCWMFLSNNIKIIFLALKLVKLLSSRSWRKCHCTCPVHINFLFTSCAGWFHTGDWIRSDLLGKIIHFDAVGKLLTKILSFVLHDTCYEADLVRFFYR